MRNLRQFIKQDLDEVSLDKIVNIILNDFKKIKFKKKYILITPIYLFKFRFNSLKFKRNFWVNFILSISKNNRREYQTKFKHDLKSIPLNKLSINEINILYLISLRLGVYLISNILREKLITKYDELVKSNPTKQDNINKLALALIENRKYLKAKKIINKLRDQEKKELIKYYISIFDKNNFKKNLTSNFLNFYDHFFCSLIKNKSIIVNCPSSNQDLSHINKFDLKVTMNHFKKRKNQNNISYDISYLSLEQSLHYLGSTKLDKNISFYVTRNFKSYQLFKKNYKKLNARYSMNFKGLMFRGNLNLMPNLVLDILMCPAPVKKIFITNSDLMISPNRVKGYYPKNWNREKQMREIFLKKMVKHDPITQFKFLENCFNYKMITGDKKFSLIMKNGIYKYLSKIEKEYGLFI